MKNIFLSALFLLSMSSPLLAQESINAAGGNATGSGGSASYSIGQVAYIYQTGTTGSVSQGVQQAYDVTVVGNKDLNPGITLLAYPNPATDVLSLEIKDYQDQKLMMQLLDAGGKLIRTQMVNSRITTVQMQDLASATYLVSVIDQKNQSVKSFRVIKK